MDCGHMGPWWDRGLDWIAESLVTRSKFTPGMLEYDKRSKLGGVGERKALTLQQKRKRKRRQRMAKRSRKQNR